MKQSIYDFTCEALDGSKIELSAYRGKTLLIVNTASKCGFTPQYKGLQALYEKYSDRGLVILGFPCNQFAGQEPGAADEIGAFCEKNYGVSFPMFGKIDVNGKEQSPLWKFLKQEAPGLLGSKTIKWNFTKFLVDSQGNVLKRYAPKTAPEEIDGEIAKLLVE